MPPSWHPVPACAPRLRCRRAVLLCSNDGAASIPKFGPEIKHRCTQKVVFGEILASIPKSGLEIKNRCTQEGLNRENRASILKSSPEIKNRCTQEGVPAGFTRACRVSVVRTRLEPQTPPPSPIVFSKLTLLLRPNCNYPSSIFWTLKSKLTLRLRRNTSVRIFFGKNTSGLHIDRFMQRYLRFLIALKIL